MEKLLIVSPYLPWPLSSGGNVGVFYLLSHVSKFYDVHFVTAKSALNKANYADQISQRLPNVHFHLYDRLKDGDKKFEILRKVSRKVSQKMAFTPKLNTLRLDVTTELTPSYIDYVNKIIQDEDIRIAQIEFCEYLPFVYALPAGLKKIFIHHELQYVRNKLAFKNEKYGSFFNDYLKDIEVAALNRFDRVVTVTDIDKSKLIDAGVTVPIYTSTSAISDKTFEYRQGKCQPRMTFVGGSAHFPNLDGILWFVRDVLPKVVAVEPAMRLQIVGKWSDEAKAKVHGINPDVEFMGFVDDLNTVLADSIMVVPILIGSGMRMKILEAANYSVPFVTTVVGVEGLDFAEGTECFITDDPQIQADRIMELYNTPSLYSKIALGAHSKFVSKYSIQALGETRLDIYKSLER